MKASSLGVFVATASFGSPRGLPPRGRDRSEREAIRFEDGDPSVSEIFTAADRMTTMKRPARTENGKTFIIV